MDARAVAMQSVINPAAETSFLWTAVPPLGFWLALGSAITLAMVGYGLKKFSRLFYVYEFEHAHND